MGCPGHRSYVAVFVTARPGSDKCSKEGTPALGPTSRDFCGQTRPRKPSPSYTGVLLQDSSEPFYTRIHSGAPERMSFPNILAAETILWIFIFFPKGPEFPERLLCSINPVTSADSGRCCGRGGLRESRKVSRAEGGWQPQAARVVGSLLLGHAAQQDQPAVLLGCLI